MFGQEKNQMRCQQCGAMMVFDRIASKSTPLLELRKYRCLKCGTLTRREIMHKTTSKPIELFINELLSDNPGVHATFQAMRDRGMASQAARNEIGCAFLGCLWEMERGLPN